MHARFALFCFCFLFTIHRHVNENSSFLLTIKRHGNKQKRACGVNSHGVCVHASCRTCAMTHTSLASVACDLLRNSRHGGVNSVPPANTICNMCAAEPAHASLLQTCCNQSCKWHVSILYAGIHWDSRTGELGDGKRGARQEHGVTLCLCAPRPSREPRQPPK